MNGKTIVLIIIVAVIAFMALKSLYKTFTGKGGCSCGSGKDGKSFCSGGCSCCGTHDHDHHHHK